MTTNANATTDRNVYGAREVNGLVDGSAYHAQVDYANPYTLAAVKAAGGRITRVRLLTERTPGGILADVSYINATLADGTTVAVRVNVNNLTPLRGMKAAFIAWAKSEGVFAKGIGLLDEGNWSIQY